MKSIFGIFSRFYTIFAFEIWACMGDMAFFSFGLAMKNFVGEFFVWWTFQKKKKRETIFLPCKGEIIVYAFSMFF